MPRVDGKTHVLREPVIYFSLLFLAIIFDKLWPCLHRIKIVKTCHIWGNPAQVVLPECHAQGLGLDN